MIRGTTQIALIAPLRTLISPYPLTQAHGRLYLPKGFLHSCSEATGCEDLIAAFHLPAAL